MTKVIGIVGICGLAIGSILAQQEKRHYASGHIWEINIGAGNQSSPALGKNGIIYITTWKGQLLAINPDGTSQWSFNFHRDSVSTPAVGATGDIFFGARNHQFYCISSEGLLRWQFAAGGWIDSSPALSTNGTIYFGSWDKSFYALTADGMKLWTFKTDGPIVSSAAVGADGTIYFGSHDRNFYALSPDGSEKWRFKTDGAITSSPALGNDGAIYFTSVDGHLYAVNSDGNLRWKFRTGGFTPASPVLGNAEIIYLSVNQTHCAISTEGKLIWQWNLWHPRPGDFGESAPAARADGSVVFTGGDSYAMTILPNDGRLDWLWNYFLYGRSHSAPLILPDGNVIVAATSGKLARLEQKIPLSSTSWPMFRGNPQRTGRMYEPK